MHAEDCRRYTGSECYLAVHLISFFPEEGCRKYLIKRNAGKAGNPYLEGHFADHTFAHLRRNAFWIERSQADFVATVKELWPDFKRWGKDSNGKPIFYFKGIGGIGCAIIAEPCEIRTVCLGQYGHQSRLTPGTYEIDPEAAAAAKEAFKTLPWKKGLC